MARKQTKARTPEQQDNILLDLAYSLAERKLRDGTASSQLLCQILAAGTERKRLENEKLKADVKLSNAKVDQINESSANGELYKLAIQAFKKYSGQEVIDPDEDDDYD